MDPLKDLVVALAGLALGGAAGFQLGRFPGPSGKNKDAGARFPRDWPGQDEYLSADQRSRDKFVTGSPRQLLGKGMVPLGRTLPGIIPIPDVYGLRELRRRYIEATTKVIALPLDRRFTHASLYGPTGKGKTTGTMIPWLCWDALNSCSNVVIDVKSPELMDLFFKPYRDNGKKVLFFDPWTTDMTLGFEPLYRADSPQLDLLTSLIVGYTASGEKESGGNSEFFNQQAEKLLRALLELAQSWPRRFANLPCVQQLVSAGGDSVLEAFNAVKNGTDKMPRVTAQDLARHAGVLLGASDADVLGRTDDPDRRGEGRPPAVAEALQAVDRSGAYIQFLIKGLRRKWPRMSPADREAAMAKFEEMAGRALAERAMRVERALVNLGDFFGSAQETSSSTIATLATKVKPFAQREIAAAFSRDELDLDDLIRHETLLLVGTPLGQMTTGAGFIGSILTALVLKTLEQRPGRLKAGEPGLHFKPVFLFLDEAPQIAQPSLVNALATLRSYKVGILLIAQDRGQWKRRFGEEVTALEANTLTWFTLTDIHAETAEFISRTILGETTVTRVQKRKNPGKDGGTTKDEVKEKVALLTPADVRQGRLNGKARPDMAFHIGSPVPFPFQPVPFWNDPHCRQLLAMTRKDVKVGPPHRWIERWDPAVRSEPYLVRRQRTKVENAHKGPIDPFWETAEYLTGYKAEHPEPLVAPVLDLAAIGCTPVDPQAILASKKKGGAAQGPAAAAAAAPGPEALTPRYSKDFKALIQEEIAPHPSVVAPGPVPGWTLADRLEALDEILYIARLDGGA